MGVNYMAPIVELHNVGMKYHSLNGETVALKDITLAIEKGEFIS